MSFPLRPPSSRTFLTIPTGFRSWTDGRTATLALADCGTDSCACSMCWSIMVPAMYHFNIVAALSLSPWVFPPSRRRAHFMNNRNYDMTNITYFACKDDERKRQRRRCRRRRTWDSFFGFFLVHPSSSIAAASIMMERFFFSQFSLHFSATDPSRANMTETELLKTFHLKI